MIADANPRPMLESADSRRRQPQPPQPAAQKLRSLSLPLADSAGTSGPAAPLCSRAALESADPPESAADPPPIRSPSGSGAPVPEQWPSERWSPDPAGFRPGAVAAAGI